MRWMIWPRQYGKSYEVQRWWLEDPKNRVIIVASEQLARIRRRDLEDKLYPKYSVFHDEVQRLLKHRVVSVRSFEKVRGSFPSGTEAAVDDVEYVLHYLLGPVIDIKVCTSTGKNAEPDSEQKQQVDAHWERNKYVIPEEYWEAEGR